MHLRALRTIQGAGLTECAAVCDLDQAKAGPYAAELDAVVFTDLDAMVREIRPDGLALLVNTQAMPTAISKAIGYRLPFLCEKPPATDSDTHARLMDAAGDLPHVVAYNRRFAPYVAKAKEWLAGETLQVVTAHFSRHRRRGEDFTTTAVHAIDTALHLSGPLASARIEIAATGHVRNFFINGWTEDGVHVNIMVTPDTGSAQEHYIVRSTDKTVRVAFPQRPMIDSPGYVELHENNEVSARLTAADFGIDEDDLPALLGIQAEQELFARMLAGEAESISTLSTSLETQRLREQLGAHPSERTAFEWSAE